MAEVGGGGIGGSGVGGATPPPGATRLAPGAAGGGASGLAAVGPPGMVPGGRGGPKIPGIWALAGDASGARTAAANRPTTDILADASASARAAIRERPVPGIDPRVVMAWVYS